MICVYRIFGKNLNDSKPFDKIIIYATNRENSYIFNLLSFFFVCINKKKYLYNITSKNTP